MIKPDPCLILTFELFIEWKENSFQKHQYMIVKMGFRHHGILCSAASWSRKACHGRAQR